MSPSSREKGYSLVEVVLAAVIFGIVCAATMQAFLFISKQSVRTDDRAFAVQKSVQMMEELRSLIQDGTTAVDVLDNYDNGTQFKYTLSTLPEVNGNPSTVDPGDKPAAPLSGNDRNKYMRKVTVKSTNEPLSRQVFVRVYRTSDGEVLAETASVLRTIPPNYVPSQAYDVFVLVLENVPGWWVSLATMAPTFDNLVQDMENRNPGLVMRVHYVTRLAYGRDPYYRPTINTATRSDTAAPRGVYFLPGNIDNIKNYYVAGSINGNITEDGVQGSNDAAYPYPLADQYNHAVREPDEERMYAQAVAAYAAAGRPAPEISYRMLLDRMNGGPGTGPDGNYNYQNILLINLHGELVPMPPMRNYSDPAKRPTMADTFNQKVRAVVHSENLRYPAGSSIKLRAYTWTTDPNNATGLFPDNNSAATSFLPNMTVTVVSTQVTANITFDAAHVTVRKMVGSSTMTYTWLNAVSGTDYTLSYPSASQTVITIKNSPLRHAEGTGNTGLNNNPPSDRLYGLEYIPCLVQNAAAFTEGTLDLKDGTPDVPKNTARWTILLNPATPLPNGLYTFETRIGTDTATGTSIDEPANISRTYTWIGSTSSVPLTEQYQFLGDPRHMPYADVKSNKRFNWFFRSDINLGDYPGFTRDSGNPLFQQFGPSGDSLATLIDLPRYYQVLRNGLLNTTGFMNSVAGWSFYYIGLGGEMGSDSNNGFSSGLPIIGTPWTPNSSSSINVDEVSKWSAMTGIQLIAHSTNGGGTNTDWFSLNWIGELFPDEASAYWVANGNLPIGESVVTGATAPTAPFNRRFYHEAYGANYLNAYGQAIGQAFPSSFHDASNVPVVMKEPGPNGCGSFFNGQVSGNSGSYFSHSSQSNTATLTSTGTAVSQDFNFPLEPTLTSDPSTNLHRTFRLDETNSGSGPGLPNERGESSYVALRSTISVMETYYDSSNSSYYTSSLIRIAQGGMYAYFQPNGMAPQGNFGTAQIGKL